jgi:hypothetical protein
MGKKIRITKRQRGQVSRSPQIQRIQQRGWNLFQRAFQVLKTPIVSLPPNRPKNTNMHHLPNHGTPSPARETPASTQIQNTTRHNPRKTKLAKNIAPQSVGHLAMNE